MPFRSKKQYKFLVINEPEVFKKFKADDKTPDKDLSDKIKEDDL